MRVTGLHRRTLPYILAAGVLALGIGAPAFGANDLFESARDRFSPLPETLAGPEHSLAPALVNLGRKLFFDKRLSTDGTVSCETCHLPGLHATDGRNRAVGVENRLNLRNAPTLLNAALQFRAHWDGSRENVEDQAKQSLIGLTSFGNPDYPSVIAKLKALGYEKDFQMAFPSTADPIQPDHWGQAIGAYERTLVSPSPFDAYLKGSMGALTDTAKKGLRLFIEVGCANCHDGTLLGGMRYAKFGLFEEVPNTTGDEGRARVTQLATDQRVFKIPQLRNVAMTPPYFHDGSVEDLSEAIRIMAKVQLNRELSVPEIADLRAFLESLTGPVPTHFSAPRN